MKLLLALTAVALASTGAYAKTLAEITASDIDVAEHAISRMCRNPKGIEPICWKAKTGFSYAEKMCALKLLNSMSQDEFERSGYSINTATIGALAGDTCSPRR